MRINALWIDDQPNEAFIDLASQFHKASCDEGIYIEVFENVDDGIKELMAPRLSYDVIILDANCVSHSDNTKEPDVSALQYALLEIERKNIYIPWFVYSAGGFSGELAIETIVKPFERSYDNKYWYRKPAEMNLLFDKIVDVVEDADLYKLKSRFPEIFKINPHHRELVEILKFLDVTPHNNPDVFNKIRDEIEWAMKYCYDCGILMEYDKTKISEHSKALCNESLTSEIVPLHIQRSFHSLTMISNEGSHPRQVKEMVRNNKAPYLIQSSIYELLNIIHWIGSLPVSDEDRFMMSLKVKKLLESKPHKDAEKEDNESTYEGKVYEIEQDDKKNYHCGKCLLPYMAADGHKGEKVTLYNVTKNTKTESHLYPFFAKFKPIIDK